MTIYKLYSGTVAGSTAAASLDIVANGKIVGIEFSMIGYTASGTSGDIRAEVAFNSTANFTSNDVRNVLASAMCGAPATSGQSVSGVVNHYIPMEINVAQGERLYLHTSSATNFGTMNVSVYLYVDDGAKTSRLRA